MEKKPFIDDPSRDYTSQDRMEDIGLFVNIEKPVHVYRNLHKNCFSVRQSGTVMFHTNYLAMKNCDFVVNPGGRLKVLETGQKNVHAYVKGVIVNPTECYKGHLPFQWDQITYNPKKYETFVSISDSLRRSVKRAKFADLAMMFGDDAECSILAGFCA